MVEHWFLCAQMTSLHLSVALDINQQLDVSLALLTPRQLLSSMIFPFPPGALFAQALLCLQEAQ